MNKSHLISTRILPDSQMRCLHMVLNSLSMVEKISPIRDILARNRKLLYSLSSALSKLAEQQSNIPMNNNTNQNQADSVEATQKNHEEKSQPTKRKKGNKQQNGSENGHTKHDTQPEETQDAKKRVRIDLDANIHQGINSIHTN